MGSGRGWLADDWPSTGAFLTLLQQPALWASTGWSSGNITRTQNVSEYMLVLALCLVMLCEADSSLHDEALCKFHQNF